MGGLSNPIVTPGGGIGAAGKFLRTNSLGTATLWDGVTTYEAIAMVGNSADLPITDSGVFAAEITGILTADGVLTPVLAVPADAFVLIFDNKTSGNFALTVLGFPARPIPRGTSIWYWDGIASLEMIARNNETASATIGLAASTLLPLAGDNLLPLSALFGTLVTQKGGMADIANARIVIQSDGDYLITAQVGAAFTAAGSFGATLHIDGAPVSSSGAVMVAAGNSDQATIPTLTYSLRAGAIVQLYAYSNLPNNITAALGYTTLTVTKI